MAYVHHPPQQQPEDMSIRTSETNPSQPHVNPQRRSHPPSSTTTSLPSSHPPSTSRSSTFGQYSLPFAFPPLSQPNTSSTSLLPSTAEGRPIPLDDSTAADRTTALRELNRSQPSHRYTKGGSAASTATRTTTGTFSQPVIVRTYYGPPPSSSNSRPAGRRIPLPSSVSVTSNVSNWRPIRNGMILSMGRQKGNKKPQLGSDPKLPPIEAFSFKSIMADVQQDIGAELDRIAEICARSKYSLSNQYEVQIAPHGSGAAFVATTSGSSLRHQVPGGPTLQAVSSDDEHNSTRHKKRRSGARRRSAAYGTLETIMSSSRSSDEDKTKKKSAREIADEVRSRANRKAKGESGSSNSSEQQPSEESQKGRKEVVRRKSASFATAVIDSTRQQGQGESSSPRTSGTALVSEPAKPKTFRNHVGTMTPQVDTRNLQEEPSQVLVSDAVAATDIAHPDEPREQSGLLSSFSTWIPWRTAAVTEVASSHQKGFKTKSYAEGSLRELLKSKEASSSQSKGKGVDRGP